MGSRAYESVNRGFHIAEHCTYLCGKVCNNEVDDIGARRDEGRPLQSRLRGSFGAVLRESKETIPSAHPLGHLSTFVPPLRLHPLHVADLGTRRRVVLRFVSEFVWERLKYALANVEGARSEEETDDGYNRGELV